MSAFIKIAKEKGMAKLSSTVCATGGKSSVILRSIGSRNNFTNRTSYYASNSMDKKNPNKICVLKKLTVIFFNKKTAYKCSWKCPKFLSCQIALHFFSKYSFSIQIWHLRKNFWAMWRSFWVQKIFRGLESLVLVKYKCGNVFKSFEMLIKIVKCGQMTNIRWLVHLWRQGAFK